MTICPDTVFRKPRLLPILALVGLATLLFNRCGASDESDPHAMNRSHSTATLAPGTNRLINEKSPYLQQHAHNPVDWYPWGEEAFAKARREDKPIFLSIGYSTCHWCHVMEHESFEDTMVARLMNAAFIAIKVDREERPDIDNIYMAVCQMMTGGGWPLTILMTPDKKPFFATTYVPKVTQGRRIGMLDLIPRVVDVWTNKRPELLASAEQITAALKQSTETVAGDAPGVPVLRTAYDQLSGRFDSEYGGFGTAPKFPTPHNLLFLLRYWKRTGNDRALEMVTKTLDGMRQGGMYDHVGFGFHRYSTDRRWLLPHFEKMLYDQALLAMAYTEAYQATGREEYARTVREIATYVLRDMTAPDGGFYSAEDADSEGEEGKFYVWSIDEIRGLLGTDDADWMARVFNLTPEGNFREQATGKRLGTNIPYLKKPFGELAVDMKTTEPDLRRRWESIRRTLFAARQRRVHPHKDDKVLTDWNGLMIAALAKAARVLDEPSYADAARRAADLVLHRMRREDGRLLHRYRDGEAALPASVDDYAFFVWGLLELYETTFDFNDLQNALALNTDMLTHYWDEQNGGLFFTADDGEHLIARQKDNYDGAIPSGNAVAMLNLVRLGRITADTKLEETAARIGRTFAADLKRSPTAHAQMLLAVDFMVGPAYEVVIAADPKARDTQFMLRTLHSTFIPNKVVVLRSTTETAPPITRVAEYTDTQAAIDGKATAYVCRNYACQLPTADPSKMLELLKTD